MYDEKLTKVLQNTYFRSWFDLNNLEFKFFLFMFKMFIWYFFINDRYKKFVYRSLCMLKQYNLKKTKNKVVFLYYIIPYFISTTRLLG